MPNPQTRASKHWVGLGWEKDKVIFVFFGSSPIHRIGESSYFLIFQILTLRPDFSG
jgi:hypothetical protein